MAENKKISFEERLTNWAGAENVKAAKALLKGSALAGYCAGKHQNILLFSESRANRTAEKAHRFG